MVKKKKKKKKKKADRRFQDFWVGRKEQHLFFVGLVSRLFTMHVNLMDELNLYCSAFIIIFLLENKSAV